MNASARSIRLTRIVVLIIAILLIGLAAFLPFCVSILQQDHYLSSLQNMPLFLGASYLCIVAALWILYQLNLLLIHISAQQIFTEENIHLLRQIGGGCLAICLIGGISQFFYLPWLFVFLAAGFMALILHIIRNVFEQARAIKEENDYTV